MFDKYMTNLGRYSFIIPINVNSGSDVTYNSNTDFEQYIGYSPTINLNTFNVNLFLDNNEVANLNGSEWSFLLKFDY